MEDYFYTLSGSGIEVYCTCTIGADPACSALTLTRDGSTQTFMPAQITNDQTGLGMLISVPLRQTIDTGGSGFGLFLPWVGELTLGQSVPVATIGMIATFSGPNSFPFRPSTWQCVDLQGTASDVFVLPVRHERS